MTIAEFTQDLYQDSVWSYGPTPMTLEDAAYNLEQYQAEGLPMPESITPRQFCRTWNQLYAYDIGMEREWRRNA